MDGISPNSGALCLVEDQGRNEADMGENEDVPGSAAGDAPLAHGRFCEAVVKVQQLPTISATSPQSLGRLSSHHAGWNETLWWPRIAHVRTRTPGGCHDLAPQVGEVWQPLTEHDRLIGLQIANAPSAAIASTSDLTYETEHIYTRQEAKAKCEEMLGEMAAREDGIWEAAFVEQVLSTITDRDLQVLSQADCATLYSWAHRYIRIEAPKWEVLDASGFLEKAENGDTKSQPAEVKWTEQATVALPPTFDNDPLTPVLLEMQQVAEKATEDLPSIAKMCHKWHNGIRLYLEYRKKQDELGALYI